MAERLYIRHPNDLPHVQNTVFEEETRCGQSMTGMKEISEAQAVKFLSNARCAGCFPGWTAGGHGVRH